MAVHGGLPVEIPPGNGITRSAGRFARLRVILAVGVVLGLGGTLTLASWNDAEFSAASFSASSFTTESSVKGAAYVSNSTSPGPTVTFAGSGFLPGDSQYFPVLVRTKATSVAGTIGLEGAVLSGSGASALGPVFVYRVVTTTASCDATAFAGSPNYVVGTAATGATLTTGTSANVTLAAATATLPGAPTGFCFKITLPAGSANSLQGKSMTATWKFATQSS